jgi:hypothetical protein
MSTETERTLEEFPEKLSKIFTTDKRLKIEFFKAFFT